MDKRLIYLGVFLGFAFVLLICICVPLHFSYVDRQHFAFKKNTLTNFVDTTEIFENGRYGWGTDQTSVQFPATYRLVEFSGNGSALTFFTDAGEISVGVAFMYRLGKANLAKLYKEYGLAYHDRVRSIAQSELRNTATNFTIRQYQEERWNVSIGMYNALAVALPALGYVDVEPGMFWLKEINLPATVSNKKLQVFQNEQLLITQLFEQTSRQYRIQSNQSIITVENAVAVEIMNATVVAEQQKAAAAATHFQLVQSELGVQLASMAAALGITNTNSTDTLLKYMSLLDGDVTLLSGVSGAVLQGS
jgi:hypothetical protein